MRRDLGRVTRTLFLTTPALLLLGSVVGSEGTWNRAALQTSCFVTLPDGDVEGLDLGASCAFLGIPYVAPPTGDHRWEPPQPLAPWAPSPLVAKTPPPNCPSIVLPAGTLTGNEDCLKLNVWVSDPPPPKPAPVIVWLHTGAFFGASANFPGTNGQKLAEETGVIVVAPNYRLGPFGFLAHRALAAEDRNGSSGNYGLLDQRAALVWVRDNIDQFGGDPHNVTLAGTSAGGASVGLHLVSPGSAGLFDRAIVQSAYPTSRWLSADEGAAQGDAFAAALGCTVPAQVVACMRSKSRNEVLTALVQGTQQVLAPANRVYWEPVVDGVVLPDQPRALFERGAFHRVPTIVGVNRDEGWGSFVTRSFPSGVSLAQYEDWVRHEFGPHASSVLDLYPAATFPSPIEAMARVVGDAQFVCEATRLAGLIERGRTPTYLYSYEYEIDELSVDHVIHGVESNIIFGNDYVPILPPHVLDAADRALHATMSGYWTRFAGTGDPNRPRKTWPSHDLTRDMKKSRRDDVPMVRWPAFKHPRGRGRGSEKYIIFDSAIRVGKRLRAQQCELFEPLFLRSLLGTLPASAQ
jgi:para-nitrobenzyl esterase